MKFINIIVILVFLHGCSSIFQPRVNEAEIDASIVNQTELYGLKLVSLIEKKDYEIALSDLEKKFSILSSDISKENQFVFEFNHLESHSKDLSNDINELVNQYPDNSFAYLVRGRYLQIKARKARGDKWIHLTRDEQIKNMLSLQELAIKDLEKSLFLSDDNYYVHIALGNIYNTRRGDEKKSASHFQRAFELNPASYWVWAERLSANTPRWGGSYQLMQSQISEMKKYENDNKNLIVLENSVLYEKGFIAKINRKTDLAVSYWHQALDFGNDHRILIGLGEINIQKGRYENGCRQVREAIKQRPYLRRYNKSYLICEKVKI